jgi:23S rRNA pseudouridine2605 synthase
MTDTDSNTDKNMRIAKRIARAGVTSRRKAEGLIEAGKVTLNGEVWRDPAHNVSPDDNITVNGNPLPDLSPTRLWRFHKPVETITSTHDPQGRDTVFDRLPNDLPRVMTVGRLDYMTEGLLLLTNDGDLARYMELPDTGWVRRYRVRVHGRPSDDQLNRLADGITIDGVHYKPIEATMDDNQSDGQNNWITMALTEGKNREIRRIMDHFDAPVNRLIRLSYGPFHLGNLEMGAAAEIAPSVLADQLPDDVLRKPQDKS